MTDMKEMKYKIGDKVLIEGEIVNITDGGYLVSYCSEDMHWYREKDLKPRTENQENQRVIDVWVLYGDDLGKDSNVSTSISNYPRIGFTKTQIFIPQPEQSKQFTESQIRKIMEDVKNERSVELTLWELFKDESN